MLQIIKKKTKLFYQDTIFSLFKTFLKSNNPFLLKKDFENDFSEFYIDGFTKFGKIQNNSEVLNKIILFINSNNFEKNYNKNDVYHTIFDEKDYLWRINNGQSIKECLLYNPNHPFFEERYIAHYKKRECKNYINFLNEYPEINNVIFKSKNFELIKKIYKDKKFIEPFSIKIQKKGYSHLKENVNENYIHIDTFNANYKFYIYLNGASSLNGPLQILKGTHHWYTNDELMKIKIFKRDKFFNKNSPEIKNILQNKFNKIIMKEGSCFGFFGSLLHSATNVEKGNFRYTIQAYYESNDEWSTDKNV